MLTHPAKHRGMKDTPTVSNRTRVPVLLPLPLAGAYDYRSAAPMALRPGEIVTVPLNHRAVVGVVWDAPEAPEANPVPDRRLKPVSTVLPAPPMTASLRRFIDWVAAYTLSPPGAVLRMAMSVPAALEAPAPQAGWTWPPRRQQPAADDPGAAAGAGRAAAPARSMPAPCWPQAAGVSLGVLRGMAENGLLRPALLPHNRPLRPAGPGPSRPGAGAGPGSAGAALRDRGGGATASG